MKDVRSECSAHLRRMADGLHALTKRVQLSTSSDRILYLRTSRQGAHPDVSKDKSVALIETICAVSPCPERITREGNADAVRRLHVSDPRDPSVRYVPGGKSVFTRKAPSPRSATDEGLSGSPSGSEIHSTARTYPGSAGSSDPAIFNVQALSEIARPHWLTAAICRTSVDWPAPMKSPNFRLSAPKTRVTSARGVHDATR